MVLLQLAQMLLNTIGETVTRLLNLATKQYDGSWLTQLLLMLRSHAAVLRILTAVVCHLLTRQATMLSECHVHGLAAILVHWNQHPGIRIGQNRTSRLDGSKITKITPLVSYIFDSLPLSTAADMSFSLVFAASYINYVEMICPHSFPDENRMHSDKQSAVSSVDDRNGIPGRLKQLLSYLGPRLVKDLRSNSSHLGSIDSTVLSKFPSAERLLSNRSVQSLLDQSRMSLEIWVQNEIEVIDDGDVSAEWLSEYYSWVVFSRWHKPQFIADSDNYIISVLQLLAQAVLEFDTRCSHPGTCRCSETAQQHKRLRQSGRQNVFNFLQASRHQHYQISSFYSSFC